MIPEATARETVLRNALASERRPRTTDGPRPRVAIVSANYELRTTLAEAARIGEFAVESVSEPAEAMPGIATVWDVPILEPDWPDRLASLTRTSPVVALLGFADRASVTLARRQGASAFLDLPCDLADLLNALDRITNVRQDQSHAVPPPPAGLHAALARKR